MPKKAVCNVCGAEYTDAPSIEMVTKWGSEGDGFAPCPNMSCPGQMEIKGGESTLKVERYGGGIVKVGNVDVMTSVVGGGWTVDYITVTPGEIDEYRGALARAHVNIVKVVRSEGLIVFEE